MQLSSWLQTARALAPQLESRLQGCFLGAVRDGGLGAALVAVAPAVPRGSWLHGLEAPPAPVASSLVFVGRVPRVLLVLNLNVLVSGGKQRGGGASSGFRFLDPNDNPNPSGRAWGC